MTESPRQLLLEVPPCRDDDAAASKLTATAIRAWLAALPKLNSRQTYDAVVSRLRGLNRLVLTPQSRFEFAECFADEVRELADVLCQRCSQFEHPVTEQEEALSQQLDVLLSEMAISYKHILLDTLVHPNADQSRNLQRGALIRAMQFMSLQVLHAMVMYAQPQSRIWRELNALYRFAERTDAAGMRVESMADLAIRDIYAQALLLSVADPSHLMQGEAKTTYGYLEKWARSSQFRHPDEFPAQSPEDLFTARCYVDLEGDRGASLGLHPGQSLPKDARILDVGDLLRILERRIRFLGVKSELRMSERMERDLLQRLQRAWTMRPVRSQERIAGTEDIPVIGGLRGCYAALVASSEFHPEKREIELHGTDFQAPSRLSLVAIDEEPWRRDDTRGKLEQGLIRPRGFGFDVERKDADVWERANRVGSARDSKLEAKVELRLSGRQGRLLQHDASAAGLGASCDDCGLRFRVGDLVGLVETSAAGQPQVNLALVSWLCNRGTDSSLRLGLERVPGDVTPLAVRGIEGLGAGGDYQRALMLMVKGNRSLVVPAGLFEIGSVLLLNDSTTLRLWRLKDLHRSTKGFAEFGLELVDFNEPRREQVVKTLYDVLERSVD